MLAMKYKGFLCAVSLFLLMWPVQAFAADKPDIPALSPMSMQAQEPVGQIGSNAKAQFEAYRAKFMQTQKASIEANNAKMIAQLATLHREYSSDKASKIEAIRNEARQMQQKVRTAPPAEQAQIQRRSAELLLQLKSLGY
jgi:hypothetical protein